MRTTVGTRTITINTIRANIAYGICMIPTKIVKTWKVIKTIHHSLRLVCILLLEMTLTHLKL